MRKDCCCCNAYLWFCFSWDILSSEKIWNLKRQRKANTHYIVISAKFSSLNQVTDKEFEDVLKIAAWVCISRDLQRYVDTRSGIMLSSQASA